MKKQFVAIMTATLIGFIGSQCSWANEENAAKAADCHTMAVEQNVSAEDMDKFMADCLASQAEEPSEDSAQEADEKAPAHE